MKRGRNAALLLLWAGLAWGQDWDAVRRLGAGNHVEVKREDRRVFEGTLVRVTENQLELSIGSGRMRFGRSTVKLVRVREAGSGGRWFGWLRRGWRTVYEAPRQRGRRER